jgi:hypothetical protein
MKSPLAPKSPIGTIKSASAGRVFSISGPTVPNVSGKPSAPRGLTTTNKG